MSDFIEHHNPVFIARKTSNADFRSNYCHGLTVLYCDSFVDKKGNSRSDKEPAIILGSGRRHTQNMTHRIMNRNKNVTKS